jgi:hypothetical protein
MLLKRLHKCLQVLQHQQKPVPAETTSSQLDDLNALPPTYTVFPEVSNDNAASANPGVLYPPPVLHCPPASLLNPSYYTNETIGTLTWPDGRHIGHEVKS